ncbi:MAG: tol-pal system YbgF family protein [Kordia sp.]|uniref:tetratricopeptide repeat protein n=1 Tax=Kordia sp. TaxID=1965332 RepID=UPI00385DC719
MKPEELIQKYIQGTLNTAEQVQFDALLKNDLDFAQKVTEYENVHVAIKANEKSDLKSHLQQLEASQSKTDISKKPFYKNIRLAIAVVLLLLFGLIGNYIIQQATMNETLYTTYFEPYPNALQPVTRGPSDGMLLTDATRAYEAKNYEEAIKTFDIIQAGHDNPNTEISFYKAMSLLNLGKEKAALNILRTIKDRKTRFTPQIYWYGALIHIKLDENEKALKALKYLDTLETTYKTNERNILKSKLE